MRDNPVEILLRQDCPEPSYRVVYEHSVRVWRLACDMTRHLEGLEFTLLYRACLLHDVGRLYHPPHSAQAIRHGLTGAIILRGEGMYLEAGVAERHIGVGITAEDVLQQDLSLPVADYVPRTVLDHVVAHADNLDGQGIRDEDDVEERFARELGEDSRRRARAFHRRVRRILDSKRPARRACNDPSPPDRQLRASLPT